MGFKYINPGYPELFDGFKDARALRGGNSKTMNPENGVYIDLMSAAGIVKIPSLSSIYIKFDTYYKKSESRYKVLRVYSGDDVIVGLQHMNNGDGYSYSINEEINESTGDNSTAFPNALAAGVLHTVLVYVSLVAGKTMLSVTVDGTQLVNTQSSGKYEKITAVTFAGANKLDAGFDGLANIIISDRDCRNEHVAIAKLNVDNSGGVTVDTDKLKESMLENSDFSDQITALQVGQTSIDLDTGHTAAEIVDGLTVETKPPTDRGGVMFTSLAQDPISKQNWDLETLKARTFAVKAAKT